MCWADAMVSATEAILSKLLDKPLINQFFQPEKRQSSTHNIWGFFVLFCFFSQMLAH